MIYLVSILLICSLYVLTFVIENKILQRSKAIMDSYYQVRKLSLLIQSFIFLFTLILFILFSPINFLFILYTQIKYNGKN